MMGNYIMLDDKRIEMSEETAESLRKDIERGTEKKFGRAERGGEYFRIGSGNGVLPDTEDDHKIDGERYCAGNYFETEAEAEKAAAQIKYILKATQYNKIHGLGGKLVWGITCAVGTYMSTPFGEKYLDTLFETQAIANGFIEEHKDILDAAYKE